MKKLILLSIAVPFLFAFENADQLKLTDLEISVEESESILRYDFMIENTGESVIKSDFDYPGHNPIGIEFVVTPEDTLAKQMEMVNHTKFKKMLMIERGNPGYFAPGQKTPFHISYKIKESANVEKVLDHALKAKLLILDGVQISKEYPLNKYKDKVLH